MLNRSLDSENAEYIIQHLLISKIANLKNIEVERVPLDINYAEPPFFIAIDAITKLYRTKIRWRYEEYYYRTDALIFIYDECIVKYYKALSEIKEIDIDMYNSHKEICETNIKEVDNYAYVYLLGNKKEKEKERFSRICLEINSEYSAMEEGLLLKAFVDLMDFYEKAAEYMLGYLEKAQKRCA